MTDEPTSYRQALGRIKRDGANANPEPTVTYATVRDGDSELHVECRFSDGQKLAAVTVKPNDDTADPIAHRIASPLSSDTTAPDAGLPAKENVDGLEDFVIRHPTASGSLVTIVIECVFPNLARRVAGILAS